MRTRIRIRDLARDPELEADIDRRARFALARFASRIVLLQISVSDDEGPRGADKLCRATATLTGMPRVRVDSLDASLHDAVDRSLARLARAVARALDVRALYASPTTTPRDRATRSRRDADS